MKTWQKVLLITLMFAVPTFLTGRSIWPPALDATPPTTAQLPFFIFLSLAESIIFGLGMSFLLLGWPIMKNVSGPSRNLALATFFAIAWTMVSWWPHDNMHIHNGMDMQGLLYIEYIFHFTLMIAGAVIAWYFLSVIRHAKHHA